MLARRVRWLDHNRRTIRRAITFWVALLGVIVMPFVFGSDWPRFHARLMGIAAGFLLAFVVDLWIAATLSLWEVRHDRLVGDRGLPRAILRKQKRAP